MLAPIEKAKATVHRMGSYRGATAQGFGRQSVIGLLSGLPTGQAGVLVLLLVVP